MLSLQEIKGLRVQESGRWEMEKQALSATSMELEEGNPCSSPNFPKELLSVYFPVFLGFPLVP